MKRLAVIAVILASLGPGLPAAEPSAVVDLVKPASDNPWLGQRLNFAVEVAVEGRFDGATVFELPELPGAILFKPEERPVLSSRRIDDREFVVQRHDFTLFCQRPGELTVKGMAVRCSSIAEVGGEPRDHRLEVPAFRIEPRPQPDLSPGQVVVTSTRFEVEERWDPRPGAAKIGDAFSRTVTISADDVPGMLLPMLPQPDPDGLAIYPGPPSIDDRTERGAFTGRRSDSVTYLCETPGQHTLPAVRFRCWDPDKESWIIRELPAATIEVSGTSGEADSPETPREVPWFWIATVVALLTAGIVTAYFFRRARSTPEARAFADFRDACVHGSPGAAVHAFHRWHAIAGGETPNENLRLALRGAEEAIIGLRDKWSGRDLLTAVREARKHAGRSRSSAHRKLAELNP